MNFYYDPLKDFALFLALCLILLNTFKFCCLQQKFIMPSQNALKGGGKILEDSLKGPKSSETHISIPDEI